MKKNEINEYISKGGLLVRTFLEMVGKPKEYLEQQLKNYIDLIKKEKKWIIISENIEEPLLDKELYTTFAELEILFKNLDSLIYFCLEYLPSHIEIIEPKELIINSSQFTQYFNDLLVKLHGWNNLVLLSKNEIERAKKNQTAFIKNLIRLSLKERGKTINELSKDVGISEENLKSILNDLVRKDAIYIKDGIYHLNDKYR